MSDLPSSDSQRRQRRNARRRAGVGPSAYKKNAPASMSDAQAERISRPLTSGEVAKLNKQEAEAAQSTEEAAAPQEDLAPENTGRGAAARWRRLTPLSKQILLWGAIFGLATFLFSIGVNLLLFQLAPNKAAANQNQAAIQVTLCLSYIITPGLLAWGGFRATARMGMPRHGGLTGMWSSVVAILLGLLAGFILSFIFPQQTDPSSQSSLSQDIVDELTGALFNIAIGFGAGWVGGRYAEWKRNKAQRQQEAAVAP